MPRSAIQCNLMGQTICIRAVYLFMKIAKFINISSLHFISIDREMNGILPHVFCWWENHDNWRSKQADLPFVALRFDFIIWRFHVAAAFFQPVIAVHSMPTIIESDGHWIDN